MAVNLLLWLTSPCARGLVGCVRKIDQISFLTSAQRSEIRGDLQSVLQGGNSCHSCRRGGRMVGFRNSRMAWPNQTNQFLCSNSSPGPCAGITVFSCQWVPSGLPVGIVGQLPGSWEQLSPSNKFKTKLAV